MTPYHKTGLLSHQREMHPIAFATVFSSGFQRKKIKRVKESGHLPKNGIGERQCVPQLLLDITKPFSDLGHYFQNRA